MTKIYSLILVLMILLSCKTDSFIDLEIQQQGNQQTNFNFGNSAQRNFHGLVLSTDGNPVSGATVTIGSSILKVFLSLKMLM